MTNIDKRTTIDELFGFDEGLGSLDMEKEARMILDANSQIENKARQLVSTYESAGIPMSQEDAQKEIRNYLDTRFDITTPTPTTIHKAYIYRNAIAKTAGAIAMVAGLTITTAFGISSYLEAKKQIDLNEIPAAISQMDAQVKINSKEQAATNASQKIYDDARLCAVREDISCLREKKKEQSDLLANLMLEYKVTIFEKTGMKSAIETEYVENGVVSPLEKFLFVEAYTPNGEKLKLPITDGDTKEVDYVYKWAERISYKLYDRIKHDKLSDGRIDDNVFAVKEKWFLYPKSLMIEPGEKRAQLTKWREN